HAKPQTARSVQRQGRPLRQRTAQAETREDRQVTIRLKRRPPRRDASRDQPNWICENEMATKTKRDVRRAVHKRIRNKIAGSAERPRLAIFRSVKHIYAQVIDDVAGSTLAAASTTEPDWKGRTGGNIAAAREVGKSIAERAKAKGISRVV